MKNRDATPLQSLATMETSIVSPIAELSQPSPFAEACQPRWKCKESRPLQRCIKKAMSIKFLKYGGANFAEVLLVAFLGRDVVLTPCADEKFERWKFHPFPTGTETDARSRASSREWSAAWRGALDVGVDRWDVDRTFLGGTGGRPHGFSRAWSVVRGVDGTNLCWFR
ncbi:hypothetical protein BC567DRAFT_238042 [Phyllosticta citribraziliensis]